MRTITFLAVVALFSGCLIQEDGGGFAEASTTSSTVEPQKTPSTIPSCSALGEPGSVDECLYNLASKTRDRRTCNKIDYDNLKYKCLARFEDKPVYCERIDLLDEKDYCYRMMAFRWNNIEYCYEAFDQRIRDKCLFDYVKDKKPDPYICFQISNTTLRDRCMIQHISLGRINPRLCILISDPILEKECNSTYL